LLFGVGAFACVASIVRLHTIYLFTLSKDPFHDGIKVNLWSMIEVNTAIFCASVPALRPVLSKSQRDRAFPDQECAPSWFGNPCSNDDEDGHGNFSEKAAIMATEFKAKAGRKFDKARASTGRGLDKAMASTERGFDRARASTERGLSRAKSTAERELDKVKPLCATLSSLAQGRDRAEKRKVEMDLAQQSSSEEYILYPPQSPDLYDPRVGRYRVMKKETA
jgi:hypothetical protein